MSTRTGPKTAVDESPLFLPSHRKPHKGFEHFCRLYVPLKGPTGPQPIQLQPWQSRIVSRIFNSGDVFLAGLQLPRKNGKSSTCAAIALWDLFCGDYAANIVICAVDERQAMILFDTAAWMVEHSPELAARAHVYKDRITVPGRSATLRALPAEAKRLEGLLYTTAILDEAGDASLDTYETLMDAQGALEHSRLILIGTPSDREDSPLARVRERARIDPDNPAVCWIEYSADEYRSHDWDCEHCLRLANPMLVAGVLNPKALDATKPPAVSETRYRQRRLGQWIVGTGENWLDRAAWDTCRDARLILPGAPVVLAIDGSRVEDSTALVMVSIEQKPIVQLAQLWQPHLQGADYRVPVGDVEARIRALADIYDVRELTGDPAQGWSRTFSILADEGFNVAEFPNSTQRMMPAVAAFKFAVLEGELSHDGDPALAQHVSNAVMRERERGYLIFKPAPHSPRKIDAAVCAVMAHSRARWHWQKPGAGQLRVMRMRK